MALSEEDISSSVTEPDENTRGFTFQQTMIRVKDPKVSLDFYTRVMGMRSVCTNFSWSPSLSAFFVLISQSSLWNFYELSSKGFVCNISLQLSLRGCGRSGREEGSGAGKRAQGRGRGGGGLEVCPQFWVKYVCFLKVLSNFRPKISEWWPILDLHP